MSRDAAFLKNEPLSRHTTLGVGGPAEMLARPAGPDELARMVRRSWIEGFDSRLLGAGSNILASDDGVPGVVIELRAEPFRDLRRMDAEVVRCGAGVPLARLTASCADWGLAGAEGLAGVPGTIGGALVMNAGTSAGEIGPLVRRVWALEADGSPVELTGPECRFEYRSSALRGKIVLGAELVLAATEPAVARAKVDSLLASRRASQPRGARTAGCTFRNPPGESAGRLIDRAGLKGLAVGGARISEAHANFIEAGEDARAEDVMSLIEIARRRVMDEYGIALELEIDLWGFEGCEGTSCESR